MKNDEFDYSKTMPYYCKECGQCKDYKEAYKETLDEIEKCLKGIHYPLCDMEKYVYFYETDEINDEVQNIHAGYMQIQKAINNIRKLRVLGENDEKQR